MTENDLSSNQYGRLQRFKTLLGALCVTFLASSIFISIANQAVAQSKITSTPIVREAQAISQLQVCLNTLRLQPGLVINDYTLQGAVTLWGGKPSDGSITQMGIRVADLFTSVDVNGKPVVRFAKSADNAITQAASGMISPASRRISVEATRYLPFPLLQEAIDDPLISVESLSDSYSEDPLTRIRIVLHPANSKSLESGPDSATFEILIDPTSHRILRLFNLSHFDNWSSHSIAHTLVFSDYREEHGWMTPHRIDEAYAGMVRASIELSSFTFNAELTSSAFDLK